VSTAANLTDAIRAALPITVATSDAIRETVEDLQGVLYTVVMDRLGLDRGHDSARAPGSDFTCLDRRHYYCRILSIGLYRAL
jgi:hypothetical protein